MAAGGGGKHNKACSSPEFNVLGQETDYRDQRSGSKKNNNNTS